MNLICNEIINKNEELKALSIDEIYLNIYHHLKKEFNTEYLKIEISTEDKNIDLFFSHGDIDIESLDEIEFIQSNDNKIIYFFDAKINNDDMSEKFNNTLKLFSSTVYIKYLEESLSNLELVDHVTGIYNRRYLDAYAPNILNISNREEKKIGFLKVSIDQFKAVIDEFDYTIGDKVLKTLANSLKESVRSSDIVVKIKDDEFLIILINIINEENARMIAQKVINNFGEERTVVDDSTNQTLMKTICTGISIFPDDASSIDDIIKKSDIALYEARNKGRGQYFIFSEKDTHTIDFF